MITSVRRKRFALAAGLAALFVAGSGALSPGTASAAATYWTFKSAHNGKCLNGSATTSAVWTAACNGGPSQQWDWIGAVENWNGRYQKLRNRHSGECLMSDSESGGGRNAVWQSNCNQNTTYLYWSFDGGRELSFPFVDNSLRVAESSSDAVYCSSPTWDYPDIAYVTHVWHGSHT
ncbi:RICIN domain-containing protein [Actinomycetes bacterium KLBMP 9797]